MSLPVVVGVDGSEPSVRAVDRTADEAARHGVPLRIVHAYRWDRHEGASLAREIGKPSGHVTSDDILVVATRRARRHHPDIPVTTEAVAEEPEYVLLREARHASVVIVGHRGRGELADLPLGSVSLAVATAADCPVIVTLAHAARRAAWLARPVGTVPDVDDIDTSRAHALADDFLGRQPDGGWLDPRACAELLSCYGIPQQPWARTASSAPSSSSVRGGTATEVLADHAARLAPLTGQDVHDLITAPRRVPLLFGTQGGGPLDLEGLERVLHRLSRMAVDLPQLAEALFNPVPATPGGVTVLDARIRLLPVGRRTPVCADCAEEEQT
ncbi:universal stress protein [Streptomyces albogriseolus]|nr:universal stress protein [Streptomyces albogriseolus]